MTTSGRINSTYNGAIIEEGKYLDTKRQAPTKPVSSRRIAIVAGVLYLITHVTSVGAPILYAPVFNNGSYILGAGSETGVLVGAFLEMVCALAIVGTAVALFPVVRRHNEGIAIGYLGLRTLEAGVIATGIVPLLAVVTLRQTAGTTTSTLLTLGSALVSLHNWTTLLGPGLVCGTNTVLLAYLMYKSRLVPRFIPVLGLLGGPLVFAYNTAKMFGVSDEILSWAAIGVIPIFSWELSLAIWLIVKGFKPTAAGDCGSNTVNFTD